MKKYWLLLMAFSVSLQCMEVSFDAEDVVKEIKESEKLRVLMEKEEKKLIEFNVHYDNAFHDRCCMYSSSIHTWTMCGTEQEAQKIKKDIEFMFRNEKRYCLHGILESRLDNYLKPKSLSISEFASQLIQSMFNANPKCIPYTIKEILNKQQLLHQDKLLGVLKTHNSRVGIVVDYIEKHMGELPEEIKEDRKKWDDYFVANQQ